MPTFSQDLQRRTRRFHEQRWLLDAVIETIGVEWAQNRLDYLSGPLSPYYKGPVLGLEKTVKGWDDIASCGGRNGVPTSSAVSVYVNQRA